MNGKLINVQYSVYVQDQGWLYAGYDGSTVGIIGKRIEAIGINLKGFPPGASIQYQAHIQNKGWEKWTEDGGTVGTMFQWLRLEAIRIKLVGAPKGCHVKYQAFVEGLGWQDWVRDGEVAGTTGKSLRMEAIKIAIETDAELYYAYSINDMKVVASDGVVVGDKGAPIHNIIVSLVDSQRLMKVRVKEHRQTAGWQDWRDSTNLVSGFDPVNYTGVNAFPIEAVCIKLENSRGYRVRYKTLVQNCGWQDWVYDGAISGTTGQTRYIEAIAIEIFKG